MTLKPFFKSDSGISKGSSRSRQAPAELVRGIPQEEIDKLKGTREHQNVLRTQDIIDDYARVGITISDEEAMYIEFAIGDFSGGEFRKMREAVMKERNGGVLTATEKQYATQFKMCEEYCKIAPLFQGKGTEIYRGIRDTPFSKLSKKMFQVKVGDTLDLDKLPASFSSDIGTAYHFSKTMFGKGIILHAATKNLKNATSIKGFAVISEEDEVLVSKYDWKVTKVDKHNPDGFYHIHVE